MRFIGLILARKGSKRVPGKNTLLLNNKALVCHTIEAALGCKFFNDIIVGSDDPLILRLAEEYESSKIIAYERIEVDDLETSGDSAIKILEHMDTEDEDIIVLLQPTSPFRTSKRIGEMIVRFMQDPDLDCLYTLDKDTMNPAGSVYVLQYKTLYNTKAFYGRYSKGRLVGGKEAMDIDNLDDWRKVQAYERE